MWLRDMLPETGGFVNARIMTFWLQFSTKGPSEPTRYHRVGGCASSRSSNAEKIPRGESAWIEDLKKASFSRPLGREATNYLCVPFHGWSCRQRGKHTPDP